jgi:hypothetical protein
VVVEGAVWRMRAAGVECVVDVVEVLDDAALAMVAPPPTRAPVTRNVVMMGFSLRISLLTSFPVLLGTTPTFPGRRLRGVGRE